MNDANQATPPDFDEDFLQALAKWKEQHRIKDDDTIHVLMDLFRIHQTHWDEIRRRQMPSLNHFKSDIAVLAESAKILKEHTVKEIRSVDLPTAIIATIAAALAGFLIGKFL
ncbi:MAG TPA: hypothetical protein VKV04_02200 [Verrucomicrobiae bacterium]|nr:hypothetical protein [Verrucomicrobiae bacterium]